jgi:hypothetical protein
MTKILENASTPARNNGRTIQAVWLFIPELLPALAMGNCGSVANFAAKHERRLLFRGGNAPDRRDREVGSRRGLRVCMNPLTRHGDMSKSFDEADVAYYRLSE